ncbi:MAG: penicillin-binding protein 2 [Bacteroidia bacterium]|nr:penicillin-binding protein 2 [Bacteroidia bacterium]
MTNNQNRSAVIRLIIVLFAFVLIVKLFYLQVISDTYAKKAASLSIRTVTEFPDRGLITDRNGEIIVFNEDAHDLVVHFPFRRDEFDIESFCELVRMPADQVEERLQSAYESRYNGKGLFYKNLASSDFARVQEGLFQFPQFYIESRSDRKYKHNVAAHTLGYVAEISRYELDRDHEGYYDIGEYIGKSGLEKDYEKHLRGTKGKQFYLKDNAGRLKERYNDGLDDTKSVVGEELNISLDVLIQEYGEKLMQGKTGSIVAIEPSTGEILAMVTSPGYTPDMFAIKNLGNNYARLVSDKSKPLLNRATSSMYPPGSTFKVAMALIGLQEGVISPATTFSCNAGFHLGSLTVRCHGHAPRPNVKYSIQTSCNAFYCNLYREILHQDRFANIDEGYTNWRSYLKRMGFGDRLGADLSSENRGNIPTSDYFHKVYGTNKWKYSQTISMSIGQGEVLLTPLQMANMAAMVANRGYYITPHFIRGDSIPEQFTKKNETGIERRHFETVIDGMRAVMTAGTGFYVQIPDIDICGKTGTAQNPHGENHSIFVAFAPKDNPKIAIATVVENAGYGATWAAPICTLMIEKYMNRDSVSLRPLVEQRMFNPVSPNPVASHE